MFVCLEAMRLGDKELSKLCSTWTSPVWDELDWAGVKELQVRDVLEKRQAQAAVVQTCKCLECPQFLKHVSTRYHQQLSVRLLTLDSLKCNTTNGRSRRTFRS